MELFGHQDDFNIDFVCALYRTFLLGNIFRGYSIFPTSVVDLKAKLIELHFTSSTYQDQNESTT